MNRMLSMRGDRYCHAAFADISAVSGGTIFIWTD